VLKKRVNGIAIVQTKKKRCKQFTNLGEQGYLSTRLSNGLRNPSTDFHQRLSRTLSNDARSNVSTMARRRIGTGQLLQSRLTFSFVVPPP
jgi:hypothetical protein